MFRPTVLMLALGVVLLHAASACVGGSDDTQLNPQPLPPNDPPDKSATGEGTATNPGSGSDENGSSGGPIPGLPDAGVGDGQTDGGGDH